MIEITLDQQKRADNQNYITIRDGKRGVVRLNEEDARMLADSVSFLRTERSRA